MPAQAKLPRRQFIRQLTAASAAMAASSPSLRSAENAAASSGNRIQIDPKPLFKISPWLYMQFMEPLGTTDSSVEAAWAYDSDNWRRDFIETTRDLAPDVMRFGGLYCRYYKWREGVGPPGKRPWMRNYLWGGKETNRVGTGEFVDFCRRVGAEPLYCVNFEGDGWQIYKNTAEGDRTGNAQEAADWVSYANDRDHPERKAHGHPDPYRISLWQLGNETSYGRGGFSRDQAIEKTIEFSRAMKKRDASIQLIGWGDSGADGKFWAGELVDRAGTDIDQVAIHMMGQNPIRRETVLNGLGYQKEPERAWQELMELIEPRIEKKLLALEQLLDQKKSRHKIAITEGHLSLQPRNINPILTEWMTGVYHARVMNLYERHGDRISMATLGDFNGNRWTSNTLIHQVPGGVSYLLPAGAVMRLFKRHRGPEAVSVREKPASLDLSASRAGDKFYLHVANQEFSRSVSTSFSIEGRSVKSATIFLIAPEDPRQAITENNPGVFKPREIALKAGDGFAFHFPPRSVGAVELET